MNIRDVVMVVEDDTECRNTLAQLLKARYDVLLAGNSTQAMDLANRNLPDLMLLDAFLPQMNGFDLCRLLKLSPRLRLMPVIFLADAADDESERLGFECGGADYISQPFSPAVLLARIEAQLMVHRALREEERRTRLLGKWVQDRTAELEQTRDALVYSLASLAEARDCETGNHIRRTQHYVHTLANGLVSHPDFTGQLGPPDVVTLSKSAPLHDIGKVGIPDAILLKPSALTPEEFEVMKTHTTLGRDTIAAAERILGGNNDFLRYAREISYSHHEKWDGSGYPEGLSGDAIPLSARLTALSDVYDALRSRRIYKAPLSHAAVCAMIRDKSGSHFDPRMVEVFLDLSADFDHIWNNLRDE